MRWPFDLIVFDLELNYPGSAGREEILEIGAVRLLRDGSLLDSFSQIVAIEHAVQSEIRDLTGITNGSVKVHGKPIELALKDFYEWATAKSKNVMLAAWGSDVACLRSHHTRNAVPFNFRGPSIDLKSIVTFSQLLRGKKPGGLLKCLLNENMEWRHDHGPQHRALADALNTALLLKKVIWQHERVFDSMAETLTANGRKCK